MRQEELDTLFNKSIPKNYPKMRLSKSAAQCIDTMIQKIVTNTMKKAMQKKRGKGTISEQNIMSAYKSLCKAQCDKKTNLIFDFAV